MNRSIHIFRYIIIDFIAAVITWSAFFFYRKFYIDSETFFTELSEIIQDTQFFKGVIFVPIFWIFLFSLAGSYRRIYRKSRLKELEQTFIWTTLGVVILFFALLLDDLIKDYQSYYKLFFVLWSFQFGFTYLFRFILTTRTVHRIHKRKIQFPTIIVGSNGNALNIYKELEGQSKSIGNKFIGFVNAIKYDHYALEEFIPHLGSYTDLNKIIEDNKIEEVVIAIERSETNTVDRIISEIASTNVSIKVIPKMQDILLGTVKTSSIWSPLIEITRDPLPAWQSVLKRAIDIVASIFAIIILLPIYIFTAIGVRRSSPGSIIYSQERVGKNGVPFKMHKFRSMYNDAEKDGKPRLSSKADSRITPFGSFMRKVRLDEIPQFFTVLKGDMSLVGPRPERQFFIDQICNRAPEYRLLLRIKPGITSWGQVKFGYAENIDEMCDRLKYDLLYLENMSVAMDFKIMIYTVFIVFQGRGK